MIRPNTSYTAAMEWIDICFNFTHESFRPDREAVLDRALELGVRWMLVTGADPEQSEQAVALAHDHNECLRATLGVHPHLAKDWTDRVGKRFETLVAEDRAASNDQTSSSGPAIVALGEMGLDYHRNFSSVTDQARAFEAQLELAADLEMPVFLHERDAYSDFARILERWRDRLLAAVVHCFTGDARALDHYLELDCHIGITGWVCDERRGTHLHPLLPRIPRGRLMIETDAPYLLPRSLPKDSGKKIGNGRRNEPAFLPHIGDWVARLRGETVVELAAHTTATAREFYRLPNAMGSTVQAIDPA